MMEFGTLTNDIIYTSRDIPGGSSDFCRVMEQIRILDESEGQKICVNQDTKSDKKKSKRDKEKKSKSDSENNNNNNRFWRSKKSQKSRDKSPNTLIGDSPSSSPVLPDSTKCKCSSPSSPRISRETVHAQFSTHLLDSPRMFALQNADEEFRQRSKSDCSALPSHKRQVIAAAERISPLDSLHVHWPDERKGTSLTTTLRPRSFSHGATGMPHKPILKKGSSGSLRPEYF